MVLRQFGTFSAAILLAACGGPDYSADPPPPYPPPPAASSGQAVAPPPASESGDPTPATWADLSDAAQVRGYVAEQAKQKLAKAQPDLDLGKLDSYRKDPSSAPELSGRAVERLLDLAAVDLAAGNLDAAQGTVELVRARAKNRNSAYAGNTFLCEIARRRAGDDAAAQKAAVIEVLEGLPRPRFGMSTVVFQVFQKEKQLDARLEQTKKQLLSLDTAGRVLIFDQILRGVVQNRPMFLEAVEAVRAKHAKLPPLKDYAFSTETLQWAPDSKPVVVAVWDVGTNPALFSKQLYKNPKEQPNGKDDDGNGLVDDISGIVDEAAHTKLLFEPDPKVLAEYKPFLRGIMDLRAGMASSPDAKKVLALFSKVENAEQQEKLEKSLDAVGEWAHGTHVAGIMTAGVPRAKLAIFRSAWAGEARLYHHRGPTDAELAKERQNIEAIAQFINENDVRVVNASLGFTQEYLEDQLRHEKDKYATDAEVKARAKLIQQQRRENWKLVFEKCPKTLFVIAAGNENNDVVEYEVVASGMRHDNVIAVGAVDRYGNWAPFTNSNSELVQIFDHGVEVDSLIPSGEKVPLSGTSMASPNVANLATKLASVNAALSPQELKEVIISTGDPIAAPFNGRIANEKKALAEARKRRK